MYKILWPAFFHAENNTVSRTESHVSKWNSDFDSYYSHVTLREIQFIGAQTCNLMAKNDQRYRFQCEKYFYIHVLSSHYISKSFDLFLCVIKVWSKDVHTPVTQLKLIM